MTLDEKILEAKADLYCLLTKKNGALLGPQDLQIICIIAQDHEVQREIERMKQCKKV